MPTRASFPERRKQRREEAEERAAARKKRSDSEQLQHLERAGHGHCREAIRLRENLEKEK